MNTYRVPELAELVAYWLVGEPDLVVHDAGGPAECVVRSGQLVVAQDDVAPALRLLDRWVDRVEPAERAKLAVLRLREQGDACVRIAADHVDQVSVAANHVHVGGTTMLGTPILHGTGADPVPCEPLPAPPDEDWTPPVTVAVLDTGLDPHPWFARRRWLSDWGLQPEVLDGDRDKRADRQAGHGTFVAGVLLRAAPGVTVRHHRVLSSQGLTDDRTVAAALRAIRRKAADRGEHLDVVLVTSGAHSADDRCPPLLAREFARFTDAVGVAAAGNTGTTRPFWPAALPDVVAVAATDGGGGLAEFSNRGPWCDAAAPGVDVRSCHVEFAPTGGVADGTEARTYGSASWSGTSFAAPAVAGDLAVLLSQGRSVTEARDAVVRRHPFEG